MTDIAAVDCSWLRPRHLGNSVGAEASFGRRAAQVFAAPLSVPDNNRLGGSAAYVPLSRALQIAPVFAEPIEIGVER